MKISGIFLDAAKRIDRKRPNPGDGFFIFFDAKGSDYTAARDCVWRTLVEADELLMGDYKTKVLFLCLLAEVNRGK